MQFQYFNIAPTSPKLRIAFRDLFRIAHSAVLQLSLRLYLIILYNRYSRRREWRRVIIISSYTYTYKQYIYL